MSYHELKSKLIYRFKVVESGCYDASHGVTELVSINDEIFQVEIVEIENCHMALRLEHTDGKSLVTVLDFPLKYLDIHRN